jgi:PhnB protein
MPVTLDACLFFPGNTERAIGFCQEVFGGQATITRRGGAGPAASEAEKDQVVNALLTGGDVALRASDRDDATLDLPTRVELSVLGAGEPRLRAILDGLANGGTVRGPLAGQCWGGTFGAGTGQYGIGWQSGIGSAGACGPGRSRRQAAAHTALRGGNLPVLAAAPTLPAGQW